MGRLVGRLKGKADKFAGDLNTTQVKATDCQKLPNMEAFDAHGAAYNVSINRG